MMTKRQGHKQIAVSLAANINPGSLGYMKNKICLVRGIFSSKKDNCKSNEKKQNMFRIFFCNVHFKTEFYLVVHFHVTCSQTYKESSIQLSIYETSNTY